MNRSRVAATAMAPHVHRHAAGSGLSGPAYPDDAFVSAAALFRALGDVERLRLLEQIVDGERCVTEIADASGANLSTVSQRLRVLRSEGLVVHRKEGKHVFYKLTDRHIVDLVQGALAHATELAAPGVPSVRDVRGARSRARGHATHKEK